MRLVVWIGSGFLTGFMLLGSLALWGLELIAQPGSLAADTTVVVRRGSGLSGIAQQLSEAGIVGQPTLFVAGARLTGAGHELKAGEYAFPAGVSIGAVLDQMRAGKTVVRRLTVPEGLTSADIMALLQAEPALTGGSGTIPPEGSLLPETYHYAYGDNRAELVQRMQAAMKTALDELWKDRSPDTAVKSQRELVTLASIVEKETGVSAERARVAGVFVNRLGAGMKLQSDPTVAYALTEGRRPLGRLLARADLRVDSPYNTYQVEGLPPGPIANPGRASLIAVLHPERHEFLYFVADGSGGHAFAKSLSDHNRNVAHWRQLQRQSGSSTEPLAP